MYVPKIDHQEKSFNGWSWTPSSYVFADAAAAAKTPEELSAWLSVPSNSSDMYNSGLSPVEACLVGCMSNQMVINGTFKLSEMLHPTSLKIFLLQYLKYPETVLYDLACDESFIVRVKIASMPNLPYSIQTQLMSDEHKPVRLALLDNPTVDTQVKIIASLHG